MTPSILDHNEENKLAQRYPSFFRHASKGERSVLIAVSLLRGMVDAPGDTPAACQTAKALKGLLPQYAGILRQTEVWKKVSNSERALIDRELLQIPTAGVEPAI